MAKDITIVAGPDSAESERQTYEMGYKIGFIGKIAKRYGINFKFRSGAWKPRTEYWEKGGNGDRKKVFHGVGEIGLEWMKEIAERYDLPIVSEAMSEMDIRHFNRHLEPERDYIQIGARTSQAFALLYEVGGTSFGVLLKNPQHGVSPKEVIGSSERFLKTREWVYCIRGQTKYIHPDGENTPEHSAYLDNLLSSQHQHQDARNLNNIKTINALRKRPDFDGITLCHDPSHVWGGKTHETRRKIGEYAVKAFTEFDYDWIIIEVNDRSANSPCDREQALATTLNGIDWSQTYVGAEPPDDQKPLSLVDIVEQVMLDRVVKGQAVIQQQQLELDLQQLHALRWDITP